MRLTRGGLITAGAAAVALWVGAAPAPAPAQQTGFAGSYLAGRAAAAREDHAAAARFYAAALARDPDNRALRDRALTFMLLSGDLRGAAGVAGALARADPDHRLAALALVADDFRTAEFDAAADRLSGGAEGMNALVRRLLAGWAEVGRADREAMEAAFAVEGGDAMTRIFASYHLGLARAAMGDLEGAETALRAAAPDGSGGRRPTLALAAVLEMTERQAEARELLEGAVGPSRVGRRAQAELARMARGEGPSLLVRSARSGAAETFFSIAGALGAERGAQVALLYARLATALRPELHEGHLLIGDLLSSERRWAEAASAYATVPRRSPLFPEAEIGRADALQALERHDEAIAALERVAEAEPESLRAWLALASARRRAERWERAAEAYDRAIALIDPVEPRHWGVFYERGIAHERAGQWEKAEADFLKALELEPEQPLVLNYLGYSWVELRRNLERAQDMIERAVEQRPEDGYITDSLGWVLYRVGKYEAAVPHLERAVELEPTDPIINDHLGDALWMVGRRLEARFQWKRALSFDPEPEDAERIRAKLERGLDAVLREEAAAEEAASADAGESEDG